MDKHITQNQANLTRVSDVLQKTTYEAPFDGVITNLPVREGETVVIGIQNSPGSTLMTIADMSVITSEVKVDETDIVNVHLGQPADVTIDAIPHKIFPRHRQRNRGQRHRTLDRRRYFAGHLDQRGSERLQGRGDAHRSAADLRPGLSSTAKITTATRSGALSIPIQALTVRSQADLQSKEQRGIG